MKKLARIMAMALVLALALSLAACSGGESGDTWNMTYWMARGEDASYYSEYEDNPVYKYIAENRFRRSTLLSDLSKLSSEPPPTLTARRLWMNSCFLTKVRASITYQRNPRITFIFC